MHLLDTDVISDFRKPRPHPKLIAWSQAVGWSDLSSSAVTLAEIERGAEIAGRSDPQQGRAILNWLDRLLSAHGTVVLPLYIDAGRIWGRMTATPALRHFLLADPRQSPAKQKTGADLMIASIAIASGRYLVTGNTSHMAEIHGSFPIPGIYDPFRDEWSVKPSSGPNC